MKTVLYNGKHWIRAPFEHLIHMDFYAAAWQYHYRLYGEQIKKKTYDANSLYAFDLILKPALRFLTNRSQSIENRTISRRERERISIEAKTWWECRLKQSNDDSIQRSRLCTPIENIQRRKIKKELTMKWMISK